MTVYGRPIHTGWALFPVRAAARTSPTRTELPPILFNVCHTIYVMYLFYVFIYFFLFIVFICLFVHMPEHLTLCAIYFCPF